MTQGFLAVAAVCMAVAASSFVPRVHCSDTQSSAIFLCFAHLILKSQVAVVGEVSGCGVFLSLAFSLAVHFLDAEAQVGTLIGVSTLYFTNSNVIASPLWPVPSEERSKIRMLFYYACCPAGCLWTGQNQTKPMQAIKPNRFILNLNFPREPQDEPQDIFQRSSDPKFRVNKLYASVLICLELGVS